jgi:hypothetical protein
MRSDEHTRSTVEHVRRRRTNGLQLASRTDTVRNDVCQGNDTVVLFAVGNDNRSMTGKQEERIGFVFIRHDTERKTTASVLTLNGETIDQLSIDDATRRDATRHDTTRDDAQVNEPDSGARHVRRVIAFCRLSNGNNRCLSGQARFTHSVCVGRGFAIVISRVLIRVTRSQVLSPAMTTHARPVRNTQVTCHQSRPCVSPAPPVSCFVHNHSCHRPSPSSSSTTSALTDRRDCSHRERRLSDRRVPLLVPRDTTTNRREHSTDSFSPERDVHGQREKHLRQYFPILADD